VKSKSTTTATKTTMTVDVKNATYNKASAYKFAAGSKTVEGSEGSFPMGSIAHQDGDKSVRNGAAADSGSKKGFADKERDTTSEELHCFCRLPELDGEVSVLSQCEKCDSWYHPHCVNAALVSLTATRGRKFECPLCLHRSNCPSAFAFAPASEWKIAPTREPTTSTTTSNSALSATASASSSSRAAAFKKDPSGRKAYQKSSTTASINASKGSEKLKIKGTAVKGKKRQLHSSSSSSAGGDKANNVNNKSEKLVKKRGRKPSTPSIKCDSARISASANASVKSILGERKQALKKAPKKRAKTTEVAVKKGSDELNISMVGAEIVTKISELEEVEAVTDAGIGVVVKVEGNVGGTVAKEWESEVPPVLCERDNSPTARTELPPILGLPREEKGDCVYTDASVAAVADGVLLGMGEECAVEAVTTVLTTVNITVSTAAATTAVATVVATSTATATTAATAVMKVGKQKGKPLSSSAKSAKPVVPLSRLSVRKDPLGTSDLKAIERQEMQLRVANVSGAFSLLLSSRLPFSQIDNCKLNY
jgi:hypothetical protein